MLNGLDLFSGIGGITLALSPWVRPVAYCENDRFAQAVLLSRMADRALPVAPIWDDVRTLSGRSFINVPIDIISGGFPCQDISCAGLGAGLGGERSGLVFELIRLIDECRPGFVFLENVSALRSRGAERVTKELASRGYDCRWAIISAQEVGAPHQRKRWFLLAAHPKRLKLRHKQRGSRRPERESSPVVRHDGENRDVANTDGVRKLQPSGGESEIRDGASDICENVSNASSGRRKQRDSNAGRLSKGTRAPQERPRFTNRSWWEAEPDVARVVDALPFRVDRTRALGNAVVPAQAREAFKRLIGIED